MPNTATDGANSEEEDTESAPIENQAAEVANIENANTEALDTNKKKDTNDDNNAKLAENRLLYAKLIPICRMIADKARVGHPNFKDMSLMARCLERAGINANGGESDSIDIHLPRQTSIFTFILQMSHRP